MNKTARIRLDFRVYFSGSRGHTKKRNSDSPHSKEIRQQIGDKEINLNRIVHHIPYTIPHNIEQDTYAIIPNI